MARGANRMGWAVLLVVVMALLVGEAQGFICSVDCTRERNTSGFWATAGAAFECMGLCLHYSDLSKSLDEVKPSPALQRALELLAQAPEMQQDVPSLGRKAFPPSKPPMMYQDFIV